MIGEWLPAPPPAEQRKPLFVSEKTVTRVGLRHPIRVTGPVMVSTTVRLVVDRVREWVIHGAQSSVLLIGIVMNGITVEFMHNQE